jgi:hypothetical protein
LWYYRCLQQKGIKPTIFGFWADVDDYVYGDDKLNVVRQHGDVLNALSMREFFLSLNMDFTDSFKRPITVAFQDVDDVSFLKRSFVWHSELQQVVCPLDLRTLFSGLSFVDFGKDIDLVMRDKVNAFQREIYLHPDYDDLLADFLNRLNKFNMNFIILDKNYLKSLYKDDNFVVPLSWGDVLYH